MKSDIFKKTYQQIKKNRCIHNIIVKIFKFFETIVYGGNIREAVLVRMLGALHRSQFRREWIFYSHEQPHFYNHRWNGFNFVYSKKRNPYYFLRGFYAFEILRDGDHLLDIGCGDGFFSKTFFSNRCSHIDAIDIDTNAINTARILNNNQNISFYILDAVKHSFPSDHYDVVVWDGAIGHFSQNDLFIVLTKISRSLSQSGIFVGSESLGVEGTDHLHYFKDESALASVFKSHFKHVLIRTTEYQIEGGFLRKEAYWRCTNDLTTRHNSTMWIDFAVKNTPTNAEKTHQ